MQEIEATGVHAMFDGLRYRSLDDLIEELCVENPDMREVFERRRTGQRVLDKHSRWRRLEPGRWGKWTGWYVRNVETLEVWPVILRVSDCSRRKINCFAVTCLFGNHAYSKGVFYRNLASVKAYLDKYPVDTHEPGWKFYKEGANHGNN